MEKVLPKGIVFFLGLLFFTEAQAVIIPPRKLGISTQIVSTSFELSPKANPASKLNYRPAQSNYVGVILGYRWIGGTLAFAVPSSRDIRAIEGQSKYRDYRLSYYYRRIGVEAGYNEYKGYILENSSVLSAATLNGETYYKLPDLKARGYGLNLLYVMNPKLYSLPAALDQSEVQDRSAGSWVLLGTFRDQLITNPTAIIPTEKQSEFGSEQLIRSIKTISMAAGAGYGINFVPGIFFVSPLLAATVGYQQVIHESENGGGGSHGSLALNLHARIGMGINSKSFFLTGGAYVDVFGKETEVLRISNNVYGFTLAVGVRF